MRMQTIWVLGMLGLAIVLLGAAILANNPDTAGRILAIVSIVVGALVAAGSRIFKNED